uniref:Uncharacterized protein n=1 Tax=Anopheles arabiensis TaxID=7173 RepID=A0A8W7MTB2_ANOAR
MIIQQNQKCYCFKFRQEPTALICQKSTFTVYNLFPSYAICAFPRNPRNSNICSPRANVVTESSPKVVRFRSPWNHELDRVNLSSACRIGQKIRGAVRVPPFDTNRRKAATRANRSQKRTICLIGNICAK